MAEPDPNTDIYADIYNLLANRIGPFMLMSGITDSYLKRLAREIADHATARTGEP